MNDPTALSATFAEPAHVGFAMYTLPALTQ